MPAEDASSPPTAPQSTVVEGESVARALVLGVVNAELRAFVDGPLTVSQWAAQREEPLYRTLRRIQFWQRLGVLTVQRERARAGRPVRVYGLSAEQFFIPRALLPPEEVRALVSGPDEEQFRLDITRAFGALPAGGGTQIVLTPQRFGAFLVSAPGELWAGEPRQVLIDRWATLHLGHADALAFQDELDAVFARYASRRGPQKYAVHVRLVATSGP